LKIPNSEIASPSGWIWEAINAVEPVLVVIEYNSLFGDQYAVTIPYDPQIQSYAGTPFQPLLGSFIESAVLAGNVHGVVVHANK
jgi:hypothetical protein